MFDLDGTIVLTDKIYFNVWSTILSSYNIVLTDEIFKKYIQGNNDNYVIKTLLNNININIDTLKDKLFLENIDKIQVVDGIHTFMQTLILNNHKCCIVTNCNKITAEAIIKHIQIDTYIDFIISSNDCKYGKPYAEPYMNAMSKYNLDSDSTYFIF
jgi:beta-phosphoglucomutase-like phosphatase (HAD superfamily)